MNKKAILLTRFPYESAWGGEEQHTLSLARHFRSQGFEVIFMGSCPILLQAFSDEGFPVKKIWGGKMIVTPWQLFKSFYLFPFLVWNLRRHFKALLKRHDIKACVFLSLNEKLFLTGLALQLGIPVTWIEHQEIRSWLLNNPWKWLYKKYAKSVRIVPISDSNHRILIDRLHLDPVIIRNIVNGVEIPEIDLSGRVMEKNLIVAAARFIEKKGMMDFLLALRMFVSHSTSPHVILIGEGAEERFLMSFIQQHLMAVNIDVFHFLKKEKWFALLEKADIFVLPARDESETFSLSAAEAMARGCKLVVTRCSGIAAKLRDGYDAFIAEPQDPSSLNVQIIRALRSPDEVRRNGFRTASMKFNLQRMLREYDELIFRL